MNVPQRDHKRGDPGKKGEETGDVNEAAENLNEMTKPLHYRSGFHESVIYLIQLP